MVIQMTAFLTVGVVTFCIDTGVSYALFHFFHLPAYLASAVGFLSGFFFNFPMNRKKVFHHSIDDRFSLKSQIAMYATLSIFNLFMTSLAVEILVHHGQEIQYAKVMVTAVMAVWNFILFKTVIFSKKPQSTER